MLSRKLLVRLKMQLIIYNHNSKQKTVYRISNAKDLFDLADRFPYIKPIILKNAESPDLFEKILAYLNRRSYLHAYILSDHPMQKSEKLKTENAEVFKTKLNAWAQKRAKDSRLPVDTGKLTAQDPGRLSESKEPKTYPSSLIGKLAEKIGKWRESK